METWKTSELKKSVPFGQLPVLDADGKILAQSSAINRYLGRQFGLAGANDWESAQIDALHDGFVDVRAKVFPVKMEKDEGKKKEATKTLIEETLKPAFERYTKFLADNGTGFFVGKKLSWFDIAFADAIATWEEWFPEAMGACPKLVEFSHRIRELPALKEWIAKRPKTEW